MNDFRADLHCHTTCSDGTDSPKELIDLALQVGLQGISITDHDTIDAYAQVSDYAHQKGLYLLPGAEFSAYHESQSVHILAYGFDVNSKALQKFCDHHAVRRQERFLKMLDQLKKAGIVVECSNSFIQNTTRLGRPHLAKLMIEQNIVSSVPQAFNEYLSEGRVGYNPGEMISVEQTIDQIHQAQGKAVIAHPHLIKKRKLVEALLHYRFDGIEGYYGNFLQKDEEKWIKLAEKKGLLVTGGSDYHGTLRPFIRLGQSWVNKETFFKLYGSSNRTSESKTLPS